LVLAGAVCFKHLDGVTPRLQEQLGYAYDAAEHLSFRLNNALITVI
jgi:hypothetical protein